MSDLAATGCGGCRTNDGGCSWIIILLLLCSCGNGSSFGGIGGGCGGGCNDNDGCGSIIFIILILCCCGGNSFC